jgi:histidinol-phosphate aminotransferase
MVTSLRIHGGPDASGVPKFDFSTNSNACGPCPAALAAVQQVDTTRYPDGSYTQLRSSLAAFHGVDAERIVLAGSASEFIFRITAWAAQQESRKANPTVYLPQHAYGDYGQAAQAWGLEPVSDAATATVVWCCDPSSPLGLSTALPGIDGLSTVVLDRAYAPLRLCGTSAWGADALAQVWQMFSPNKSLGLTGVRAAYAIAPQGAQVQVQALEALAPSWVVGAHGVSLLTAWTQQEVQTWLVTSLRTLASWKTRQIDMLQALGWTCLPSDTNFFCARPAPDVDLQTELPRLRAAGIKLRDTASFGLPGHVRLGVLPPKAQDALHAALLANKQRETCQ